jgi:toxic protein SymE
MQIFSMLDLHSRSDRSNLDNVLDEITYSEQRYSPIKRYRLETKIHRKLKISAQSGYKYQAVPTIRLQGKWLEEFGFEIGKKVNVECVAGKLSISLEDATT